MNCFLEIMNIWITIEDTSYLTNGLPYDMLNVEMKQTEAVCWKQWDAYYNGWTTVEPKSSLKRFSANGLPLQIIGRIASRKINIFGWIPKFTIQSMRRNHYLLPKRKLSVPEINSKAIANCSQHFLRLVQENYGNVKKKRQSLMCS